MTEERNKSLRRSTSGIAGPTAVDMLNLHSGLMRLSTRSFCDAASEFEYLPAEEARQKALNEGKQKRKKIQNTNQFFMELPPNERRLFALVTEDISLQNTAGLQNIKRKLWKGRALFKTMTIMLMLGQLMLNLYTVLRMAFAGHFGWNSSSYELDHEKLIICSSRIDPECFETRLSYRLLLMQVLVTAEAALVILMQICVVWSSLYLLFCSNPQSYAKRRHFVFIALPKLAAKVSLISFLHIGNAERLKTFILRGEFRCLAILCSDSLRSRRAENDDRTASRMRASSKYGSKLVGGTNASSTRFAFLSGEMFGFLVCGVIILVALHMLLVKLMMVYFAGILNYTDWNFNEWLLLLGFVNQLTGLSLSSETEMLRVLLFKFGGENTRWRSKDIEACATYFRYMAARTVEQAGRLQALILLWTMSSADLQALFQGHQRLKEQEAVRDREMEMFEKLHKRAELVAMRDRLLSRFNNTQSTLHEVISEADKEDRMTVLNNLQMVACGELRLAARVQEHIWEWMKVELLENDHNLRPESPEDESPSSRRPASTSIAGLEELSRKVMGFAGGEPESLTLPGEVGTAQTSRGSSTEAPISSARSSSACEQDITTNTTSASNVRSNRGFACVACSDTDEGAEADDEADAGAQAASTSRQLCRTSE